MPLIHHLSTDAHEKRDHERGAVTVVVALFMMVLLLLAGFVIDFGRTFAAEAQLQNAVDSAALAAAAGLCGTDADPAQTAVTYAAANGVTLPKDAQHVLVDTNARTVTVRAQESVATTLGNLAGVSALAISASAKASKVCGIRKFGLYADESLTFNGSGSSSSTIYGGDDIRTNGGSTANFAETDPSGTIDPRLSATKSTAGQGLTAAQYAYLVPVVGTTKLDAASDIKFDATSGVSFVDQMSVTTGALTSACDEKNKDTADALKAGTSSTRFVCAASDDNTVETTQLNSPFVSSIMARGDISLQGGGSGCITITSALIYSLGDITFQGVCLTNPNTIVYAPNGSVTFNGSANTVAGTVIATNITFNGAKQTSTNEGALLPGGATGVSLVE